MLTGRHIKKALLEEAGHIIYQRGLDYYFYHKVKKILIEENSDDTISINGRVSGDRLYSTSLVFDTLTLNFNNLQCSCPYDDVCKHNVALGLYLADYIDNPNMEPDRISEYTVLGSKKDKNASKIEENDIRGALSALGLSADELPQTLISKLLSYQKKEDSAPENKPITTKSKNFNPLDYYIILTNLKYFNLDFYKKGGPYRSSLLGHILKYKDLNLDQRMLLRYINENKFGYSEIEDHKIVKLIHHLYKSKIPCFKSYQHYQNNSPVDLDFKPPALKAEIIYETERIFNEENELRHNFYLRLNKKYWSSLSRYQSPFILGKSSLLYETANKIEVHKLTPLLLKLLDRVSPSFNIGGYYTPRNYQAKLNSEEIKQFTQLTEEASQFLNLTSPPPPFSVNINKQAKKSFVIDFSNKEQSIQVKPVIDYGVYKQDISESIYLGKENNVTVLKRRNPLYQAEGYILSVEDNIISYTPIKPNTEIDFYKELTDIASSLAFSKTLKCQKKAKQLTSYLEDYWPALSAYAKEKNYPLIFERDKLTTDKAIFRADFKTEVKADNDWLYFDLEVYCGNEKVTLRKLLTYLESDQPFWQQADGKIVEISNREELERLAKMLKSFQARENGGFEGKLRNAPELEYVMTSSPHYNAIRAKSFSQFMNRVQSGKPLKSVKLSDKINKVLRPYQKEGINWLYFLRSYHFAGILADDMGLGKTLQTLAVLYKERIKEKPSIVLCPKTLLYNWKIEAKKFFPRMKVMVYNGTPSERLENQKKLKNFDLIVTSYGTLRSDKDFFSSDKNHFNYVVLDEAQFIKNHKTKNAQVVKKLNADYRLALTGTPLENSVSELWSIYDFLMPNFLGNYNQFSKNFQQPIMDKGDSQALEHLKRKVSGFMLRRIKSEVLKELPPKIEQLSQCHLSEEQNILYQQILSQVKGEVFSAVSSKGFKSAQIHILAGLTKLRQVCNHPALLLKDKDFRKYQSAKLEMCLELVDEVRKSQRKVLIFSQFTKMLDIVSASLKDKNIEHLYLSGKTRNRQDLVDNFNNNPDIPVFLISLKAGGTGLNLTSADNVIIFDPWWNPSVENQAIDRTHRIGQSRNVNVYRLLTSGTIEEKIQALKQKKQNLFNALISTSGDKFNKLSWEDVKELFS